MLLYPAEGDFVIRIILGLFIMTLAGCGGGSSSPTTPAQIPTSVEYAGGAVSEDLSLPTDGTVSFIAKSASGEAVDASSVTIDLTKADGTAAVSGYGSCSVNSTTTSQIDCVGPSTLPASDASSLVTYTFNYGSADISKDMVNLGEDSLVEDPLFAISQIGQYSAKINVAPATIEAGKYVFTNGVKTISGCSHPNISSNGNGWVFLSCKYGMNEAQFCSSNDDGVTWSCTTFSGVTDTVTDVESKREIAGTTLTASGYFAYNTSSEIQVLPFTGDANGTVTFGTAFETAGILYDMVLTSNGDLHFLVEHAAAECTGFDAEDFIRNIDYYLKASNGALSNYLRVNGTNCSVQAQRGDLPHLALATSGMAYASWRDAGGTDGSTSTNIHLAKVNTSSLSVVSESTLSPTSPVTADQTIAAGQFVSVDKDDNVFISWDLSTKTGRDAPNDINSGMATYLSVLPSGSDTITTYTVDSITNINITLTLFSGTSNTTTYGNNVIITYRDQNYAYMTMGTLSSSGLSLTTPIVISSAGDFAVGPMSAEADWSGKSFFAIQESGGDSNTVAISLGGTTAQ